MDRPGAARGAFPPAGRLIFGHPNGVKMRAVDFPAEILQFFKEQGARGGRIGGKRSLETMTSEQRKGWTPCP